MKMDISNVIIGKRVFFRKCVCIMFAAAVIITYMFSVDCNIVKADEWDDAVKYYSNYGNAAVFKATNKMNGNIYFCSAGNTSTSGTKYRTIGYKMTIKGTGGNEIQKIYFQLGGQYLTLLNSKKQSGKEYMLYVITLQNIKTRFNTQSLNALSSGSCTIVLDACMVLRVNGKNKGGMNDNGPSWGKVYTTYAGISKAANWTDSALTALYSYYGKTVRGLFHTIDVRKSTGISSVSGGGTYCYGTYVTISASSSTGYDFTNWNNDSSMSSSSYGFFVNSGGTYTAYAKAGNIDVTFWRNTSASDSEKTTKSYTYGGINQAFPAVGWQMAGYHMTGWGNNLYDKTVGSRLLFCRQALATIPERLPDALFFWNNDHKTSRLLAQAHQVHVGIRHPLSGGMPVFHSAVLLLCVSSGNGTYSGDERKPAELRSCPPYHIPVFVRHHHEEKQFRRIPQTLGGQQVQQGAAGINDSDQGVDLYHYRNGYHHPSFQCRFGVRTDIIFPDHCRYLFFQADTETIAKYGKTVPREFPGYSRDISTGRTGNRRNLHRKKS